MQFALLLIFFSYFLTGFQITSFAGYGVTLLDFALLYFYFIFFKRMLWDGEEIKFAITPPLVLFLILFAVVLLSGITPIIEGRSDWIIQYFKTISHFYFLAGFALLSAVYPIKMIEWKGVIRLWLIIALILNIFGLYQILARAADLPLAWIDLTNVSLARGEAESMTSSIKQLSLHYGNFYRATSIFSEPSALGAFNTYILGFLLIPFVYKYKPFFSNKTFIISTLIFTALGTFFTFSLTAILGAFLVIVSFLFFQKMQHLFRYIVISLSIIAVIIVADNLFSKNMGISVVELFTKRIEGILNVASGDDKMVIGESFNVRKISAEKALEIWEHYPILGIGAGLTYKNKINDLKFSDFTVFSVLAEFGIIGLIVFIAYFLALLLISYRMARLKYDSNIFNSDEKLMLRIPFIIMIVLFIINFISGNVFVLINNWGPAAIVMSIINMYYLRQHKNIVKLRLVKYPLKTLFLKSLQAKSK